MPVGGEALGNSLSGFFDPPKVTVDRYNEALHDEQGQQALQLRDLAKSGEAASKAYAAAVAASTPEISRLNADSVGRLGELATQYQTFDPTSTYERVRGGNIASLADQFVNLATYGQQADKAALAARGYGGRGPSSYESILRSDRISKNIAPVLATIYSTLGADTTSLNNNRLANLASIIPALQYRGALPGATDMRSLLPYQAEANMLADRVNTGGSLAAATKANVQGVRSTPNKWANFFQQQGRMVDQAADTAIDLYGGAMMGGIMGGMGGAAAPVAASAAGGMWNVPQSYDGGLRWNPNAQGMPMM